MTCTPLLSPCFSASEGLKSSGRLVEFFKDPQKGGSTPFNLAYETPLSIWDWYKQPGNEWGSRRFNAIMTVDNKLYRESTFIEGESRCRSVYRHSTIFKLLTGVPWGPRTSWLT